MSGIAIQSRPPALPQSPAFASPSAPLCEAYHANQHDAADSYPASRQRSRNGLPTDSTSSHEPQMTSRAAIASPVPVASASPDFRPSEDRRRNMPPIAPPRTSSTNHPSPRESSSRRREYAADKSTSSPRRHQADYPELNGNGNDLDYVDVPSSRSRRAQNDSPHRPSSSRENRAAAQTTIPIRSHAQPQSTASPKQPSREASEVLNRVIVSQPETDIQREKERLVEAQPHAQYDDAAPPPVVGMSSEQDDGRRGGRSRHDLTKREKQVKFGDYILGNTIGEGEFGKVKLGWKQDGGIQVAIKLIKRDSVGNNPSRLAKIYREIAILRGISHPNIVRLHEMVETERHIGIILEYASGGELFDYILNHRYLKDNAARRLFAQLVSGVGYLHKKGIVHRDLKLENLLLDRNRNIIITDFGFANTFDAEEELSQEEELNLSDRDFVKRIGLDKIKANGTRKGDLMQTSCGSPCYAAPELVVSDSLYTGRKVDVWSCGVILYAMLAGYLPFDDDPANPEGDNINLLYKYIVNTPLTFPEYVTPHARDLLRRILVPNPRKRADLFEVARHSWLSEYAHVVEFITSSTTSPTEIQNTTVPSEDDRPLVARSASVREPSNKSKSSGPTSVGGLANKHGNIDPEAEAANAKQQQKDSKRRTVQVEYVAPTTQTQRGEAAGQSPNGRGKSRARSGSQGPVEVTGSPQEKPLPKDPPVNKDAYNRSNRQGTRPPSAYRNNMPPSRPGRDTRATSDNVYMTAAGTSGARPQTGGSMKSSGSMGLGSGARASYGQPIPPSLAGTNAQGSIQQPESQSLGHPSIAPMPAKFARVAGYPDQGSEGKPQTPTSESAKGHRRSSTLSDLGSKLLGRNGSMFGAKNRKRPEQRPEEKNNRKYPPISMSNSMAMGGGDPRASIDSRASRRSFSLGFGKKRSGSISESQASQEKPNRRFSLIPQSLSKAMGMNKDVGTPPSEMQSQQDLPIQDPPEVDERGRYIERPSQSRGQSRGQAGYFDGADYDASYALEQQYSNSSPQLQQHQRQPSMQYGRQNNAIPPHMQQEAGFQTGSDSSLDNQNARHQNNVPYQAGGFAESDGYDGRRLGGNDNRKFLQKNKRFTDAYDQDAYHRGHEGSSGAAKRVMDFFRRRGKARGGEER